jgi:hypothetical protein
MALNRRDFLKTGITAGSLLGMHGLLNRPALAEPGLIRGVGNDRGGYGNLKKTKSRNTGEELLALPEGFSYTVFGKTGDKMSDGYPTPSAHDGMAAVMLRGNIRLIRNHEVRNDPAKITAFGNPNTAYDRKGGGGTTTLDVNPVTRELVRDFVSLNGTIVNCAGARTPWGTWISMEETTAGSGKSLVYHKDTEQGGGYDKEHGYCFEVSFFDDQVAKPVPLNALGRFVHEAGAVDPSTDIVYLTEDHANSGFYRFLPNVPTKLAEGGRLQMARIKDRPKLDTRTGLKAGETLLVDWVDIEDPDPKNAWEDESAVYKQGLEQGGATFARLEGCWYAEGCVFINSTNGGPAKKGQIFRYRPRGNQSGELTMLFESPGAEVLDMPDNMCVSPRGGLVICEDGPGTNYLRGLTQDGFLFDFALNTLNESEFAGACFSPDGETLLCNIQNPGLTLAIWGPWSKGSL